MLGGFVMVVVLERRRAKVQGLVWLGWVSGHTLLARYHYLYIYIQNLPEVPFNSSDFFKTFFKSVQKNHRIASLLSHAALAAEERGVETGGLFSRSREAIIITGLQPSSKTGSYKP